ncbi:MAG: rhodanese-like domain-containing protein [Spirochaetota bacterium]
MEKFLKCSKRPVFSMLYLVVPGILLFFLSCSQVKSLSVEEISSLINSNNENLIIIDLRDLTEYNNGHIKGAISIPYKEDTFPERITALAEKDVDALFYCGQGVKTGKAEKFIKKSPFKKKYILAGGFFAWKKEGLEIEK